MLWRDTRLFRGVRINRSSCQGRPFCATGHLNAREEDGTGNDGNNANVTPTKRKRGRPRKEEIESTVAGTRMTKENQSTAKDNVESSKTMTTTRPRRRTSKSSTLPPRLVQPSANHHDLASFLAYAERVNLNTSTNVYKGTLYEYTVASILSRFNFNLHGTGRSNDLGIDLVGHFLLPPATEKPRSRNKSSQELRVLVQCKALKPTPAMVRELEGAYVGAPAGWGSGDVLAMLVASKEATKGVRDALQRSRWPMGLMQVTNEGEVRQFLWNAVAEDVGLAGLGVTVKYANASYASSAIGSESRDERKVNGSLALTWMGRMWKSSDAVK